MLNEKDLPVGADWRQKNVVRSKIQKITTARGVCENVTASSSPVGWVGWLFAAGYYL